ncbi:hypothetical protein [Streptomyces sp. NPDC050264]|uniref:hypothetical protein n=1 Tax=Streptomyces sp. NPDC050264 TaxID=3155038 RepID=UPI0034470FDE
MDASGLAAWAAAVTSAATLVVTTWVGGRRERHRWLREALTEAFVAFLGSSWRHSDVARGEESDAQHAALAAEYEEMRQQLTRLRLLAGTEVVKAGEALVRSHRAVQEAGSGPVREQALVRASQGRRAVLAAAQKLMGLW